MKIKITTTNIELTSAIESYIDEKINSIEKFALPHNQENPIVDITIGKTTNHHHSGDIFIAEANISLRGKQYRATSEQSDLYAAIDTLRDELARELSSDKAKTRTLVRRGAGMIKNMLRFGRKN